MLRTGGGVRWCGELPRTGTHTQVAVVIAVVQPPGGRGLSRTPVSVHRIRIRACLQRIRTWARLCGPGQYTRLIRLRLRLQKSF